jgi:hypothetical protein
MPRALVEIIAKDNTVRSNVLDTDLTRFLESLAAAQ